MRFEDKYSAPCAKQHARRLFLAFMLMASQLFANSAPQITSSPPITVRATEIYNYTLAGEDIDGDTLQWDFTAGMPPISWLALHNKMVSTIAQNDNFSLMNALVSDSSGNMFVTEGNDNILLKVTPGGDVSTFAGSKGLAGTTDGLGSAARFDYPTGLAIDSHDNLFVADYNNYKIRKITPDGNVTTFASINGAPFAVAIDNNDFLYVAGPSSEMYKVAPDGTVSTITFDKAISPPRAITIDKNGMFYIGCNTVIYSMTQSGSISLVAGSETNYGYVDATGVDARFGYVTGIVYNANSGDLYIADYSNSVIRRMTSVGNVTTLAGSLIGYQDGAAATARFGYISSLAMYPDNSLYIGDTVGHPGAMLRRLVFDQLSGAPLESDVGMHDVNLTLSDGNGNFDYQNFQVEVTTSNYAPTDITLSNSSFNESHTAGVIVGTLGAADANSGDTHTYSLSCGVAGTDDSSFTISGNTLYTAIPLLYAEQSSFDICIRVTDSHAANYDKHFTITLNTGIPPQIINIPPATIRATEVYDYVIAASDIDIDTMHWDIATGTTLPSWLTLQKNMVSTVAVSQNFNTMRGLVSDSSGNLFISDDQVVFKVTPKGDILTFAGSKGQPGMTDGPGDTARFNYLGGLAVDSHDNLFVADHDNNKIRKITPDGNVTTFASLLSAPFDVVIDDNDILYVSGSGSEIKKIAPDGTISTITLDIAIYPQRCITIDKNGLLYVGSNFAIYSIEQSGHTTVVAGSESNNIGYLNAVGSNVTFGGSISDMVYDDNSGNLYISDYGNSVIRRMTSDGNVTTLAGSVSGYQNGNADTARFNYVAGLAIHHDGSLYIGDTVSSDGARLRRLVFAQLLGTPPESDVGVHDVNLTLSDGFGHLDFNFQVDVTTSNYAPTGITLSSSSVNESRTRGVAVGTLGAVDANSGDSHTFSLSCSIAGADDSIFAIEGNTLYTGVPLLYETRSRYDICIRVTDALSATYDKNFTITLKNSSNDIDHDGLPDSFEIDPQYSNWLNPFDATDANFDADNDGFTNIEEYNAHTSLLDANDKPAAHATDMLDLYMSAILPSIIKPKGYCDIPGNCLETNTSTPNTVNQYAEQINQKVLSQDTKNFIFKAQGILFKALTGDWKFVFDVAAWGTYAGLGVVDPATQKLNSILSQLDTLQTSVDALNTKMDVLLSSIDSAELRTNLTYFAQLGNDILAFEQGFISFFQKYPDDPAIEFNLAEFAANPQNCTDISANYSTGGTFLNKEALNGIKSLRDNFKNPSGLTSILDALITSKQKELSGNWPNLGTLDINANAGQLLDDYNNYILAQYARVLVYLEYFYKYETTALYLNSEAVSQACRDNFVQTVYGTSQNFTFMQNMLILSQEYDTIRKNLKNYINSKIRPLA